MNRIWGCASLLLLLVASPGIAEETQKPAADNDPEAILNPYYRQPRWKLWTEDLTPVRCRGVKYPNSPDQAEVIEESLSPTKPENRLFPVFTALEKRSEKRDVFPVLEHFERQPTVAGFWDDCYMTLDNGHSGIRPGWAASGRSMRLVGMLKTD